MNAVTLWFTRMGLTLLFLFVSIVVIGPLYLLLDIAIGHHEGLRIVLNIFLAVYALAGLMYVNLTAERMVSSHLTLGEALRHAAIEARISLGSLPIVGRWFVPEEPRREDAPIE